MPRPLHICPFCSLHCDDVRIDEVAKHGWVANVPCDRATAGYQHAFRDALDARCGDDRCTAMEASKHAQTLLSGSIPYSLVTTGTDLDSAKQLHQLQEAGRIRVLVDETASAEAWRAAISREGTLAATLGDIRTHADVLWTIGEVDAETPRLRERIDADQKRWVQSSSLDAESLAEIAFAIRAETVPEDSGTAVTEAIRASAYLAIILGRHAFVDSEATATAEMLCKLLWHLNQKRRAVVLQLDDAATNRSVTAWQSNTVISSIAGNETRKIDLRLGTPPDGARPVRLQIGGIDRGKAFAEVFLPASTIGIHRDAVVVRGDGTVTLPLVAVTASVQPTPIERLHQWITA
ncbi:hypothetical protein Pla52o_12750 [Novipirellula galeiformis]|uniref:Formylmethanofuran dehydrogenase subunit B n=1 Tax=Novipirellula galeiformis TaxID=2528004 RepID=A0A5C6CKK1_9BACT|nr:hypothetical protein [Novipirellula galeiformis]TWU24978.1 hypothetical protein Pla52o_12750 [Novipirellula galeiformis]